MDRRTDPRVDVKLPCHVEFAGSKLSLFVGVTANMSRSGILLTWNVNGALGRLPQVGDLLSVDIELPANHSFGRRCMHCQTVVARVSPNEQGDTMVALQVNQMQFRSYNNGNQGRTAAQDQTKCSIM